WRRNEPESQRGQRPARRALPPQRPIDVLPTVGRTRRQSTLELHKRLHTHRPRDEEQVVLTAKAPTCGVFADPSDALEPSTSSFPFHVEPILVARCVREDRS